MSLASKDGFRTYLAQQQKLADNTINSYCSGLNHLSSHCGQDLFALTDVQQLNALLARYIQGGADEEQGKYGNWAASNALRHWRDYVVSLEAGQQAVLVRFASVPELAKQLNEHEQTALFCALAEGLHQCNADWWILGSGEIRAGRSEHPLMWENAVVLKLRLTGDGVQIRLKIDEQAQWQPLTEATLAEMLTKIAGHPRLKTITHRQPYWPDDYPAPHAMLWIPLREAALKQGVLHIPKLQGIFPPESIGSSGQGALKPFTLILPDGSQLLTEVVSTSDLGRIKHNFAELFAAVGLAEFDRAVIRPESANSYALHFEKAGALSSGKTSQSQEPMKQELTPASIPKNQILYGPPGTGKTYHTINEALAILDPDFLQTNSEPELRVKLKRRFDELVKEQRIRFVTFHQSFSYEDFVEGLRAETINGQLHYREQAGVFKQICDSATATPEQLNLDEILDRFIEEVAESPQLLNTVTGKQFLVSYRAGNTTLTCEPQASETAISLPANIDHIRTLLAGKTVDKIYCASYVKAIVEHVRKQLSGHFSEVKGISAGSPYVLIIDEINRGNISRIFGELITLIEPSKRAGANEALSVTLPYSKEPFSVPDNVYLIGTMNTADRSLAGLDIALRRRFTFKEMPPKPELLDGLLVEDVVDIGAMLRVMNQRIAVLLDRDHCLGHAYFMPLAAEGDKPLAKLAEIFEQNIIPLLQEYFFEDWERIRWVLNDQNKAPGDAFIVEDADLRVSELFVGVRDKLRPTARWRIDRAAFQRIAAYTGIWGSNSKLNESGQD